MAKSLKKYWWAVCGVSLVLILVMSFFGCDSSDDDGSPVSVSDVDDGYIEIGSGTDNEIFTLSEAENSFTFNIPVAMDLLVSYTTDFEDYFFLIRTKKSTLVTVGLAQGDSLLYLGFRGGSITDESIVEASNDNATVYRWGRLTGDASVHDQLGLARSKTTRAKIQAYSESDVLAIFTQDQKHGHILVKAEWYYPYTNIAKYASESWLVTSDYRYFGGTWQEILRMNPQSNNKAMNVVMADGRVYVCDEEECELVRAPKRASEDDLWNSCTCSKASGSKARKPVSISLDTPLQ